MRSIFNGFYLTLIVVVLFSFGFISIQSAHAQQPSAKPNERLTKPQASPTVVPPGVAALMDKSGYHEDYSAPSLATSILTQQTAILGQVDDRPELPFIRERWQVLWRPGDPIDLYIIKPRFIKNAPVVLYLYSYPQSNERFKSDIWCGTVTGDGFAAVGFVAANTDHRLENLPPREFFFSELNESLTATVHDVQMILNFITSRKEFDMDRVGMFGQGSGGAIAILASTADSRIKALDLLTPWGDWPTFLTKSTFIPPDIRPKITTPEFMAKVAPLEPVQLLPKIQARSLRIQNVRTDGHMPDAAQERLEAVAPDFAEIDQFGDRTALVPATMNGRLLGWIKEQLKAGAKPQVALDRSQRIHFYPAKAPASPLPIPHNP
jgi:hypothetical protein